jgi:hypothetical protein
MTTNTENLKIVSTDDDSVISINDRKKLGELEKKFPNMEIIIGKANNDDKPISLDLAEMEFSRQKTFDAATESIMGKRIDKMQKAPRFPLPMVTGLIGFLLGVAATFFAYNI